MNHGGILQKPAHFGRRQTRELGSWEEKGCHSLSTEAFSKGLLASNSPAQVSLLLRELKIQMCLILKFYVHVFITCQLKCQTHAYSNYHPPLSPSPKLLIFVFYFLLLFYFGLGYLVGWLFWDRVPCIPRRPWTYYATEDLLIPLILPQRC